VGLASSSVQQELTSEVELEQKTGAEQVKLEASRPLF